MIPKQKYKEILSVYGRKYSELARLQERYDRKEKLSLDAFKAMTPTRIFFEPTNKCNLDCVYCARSKMTRNFSFLSIESFKSATRMLPKGSYIVIVGNGEPTLHKKVFDMIRYAVDQGFIVCIITNGTLLTEKKAVQLIKSGVHRVQISFDTIDRPIFYSLQKRLNNFDKTLYKILRFIHLARNVYNSNVFITISAVMTEENIQTFQPTRDFWNTLPIDNLYEGPLLSLQTDSGSYNEINIPPDEPWKICVNPWTSIKINSDGSVNPCVVDFSSKYVIGNVNEKSLVEIANSEAALAFRKALYEKDDKFFEKIGYNCHLCNGWTKETGSGIEEFLADIFPITYGLMINEVSSRPNYGSEKLKRLEEILADYDGFIKSLAA